MRAPSARLCQTGMIGRIELKAIKAGLCLVSLAFVSALIGCPTPPPSPRNLTHDVSLDISSGYSWASDNISLIVGDTGAGPLFYVSGVTDAAWSDGTFDSSIVVHPDDPQITFDPNHLPAAYYSTTASQGRWTTFDCTLDGTAGIDSVHLTLHVLCDAYAWGFGSLGTQVRSTSFPDGVGLSASLVAGNVVVALTGVQDAAWRTITNVYAGSATATIVDASDAGATYQPSPSGWSELMGEITGTRTANGYPITIQFSCNP